MGSSCCKAVEPLAVVAVSEVTALVMNEVRDILVKELKEVIIPECINLLQMSEEKLNDIKINP